MGSHWKSSTDLRSQVWKRIWIVKKEPLKRLGLKTGLKNGVFWRG